MKKALSFMLLAILCSSLVYAEKDNTESGVAPEAAAVESYIIKDTKTSTNAASSNSVSASTPFAEDTTINVTA